MEIPKPNHNLEISQEKTRVLQETHTHKVSVGQTERQQKITAMSQGTQKPYKKCHGL